MNNRNVKNIGSIHPAEFLDIAKFSDCTLPIDITKDVKSELHDMHPSMFIGDRLTVCLFKVTYRYTTKRGNKRENYKILLTNDTIGLDAYESEIMVETKFQNWISDFNFAFPFKAISNVEILDIQPYCNANVLVG